MGGNLDLSGMLARRKIAAEDVVRLRRDIFPDGVRTASEADTLFRMDRECEIKDESWREFYVEALAEFFIFNTEPAGGLSDEQAQHLIRRILEDGRIAGETELALVLRIIERAHSCPPDLGYLALRAVRDSVMSPEKAAYGNDRHPGEITPEDVEILRQAIRAPAGDDGTAVSRAEAELLFALERETDDSRNDIAWRDLFVQTVGSHLLGPKRGTTHALDSGEAGWLLGQISDPGNIRNNERALLTFLHGKLDFIPASLAPLFAAEGLR